MNKNLPQEAGYYWARTEARFDWWNMIVEVHGTFPYLKIIGWVRGLSEEIKRLDISDICDFGPKIEVPIVPPENIKR